MNVVVIGGSEQGKFGNDLVKRLRTDGHLVRVLSHRARDNQTETVVANFTSLDNVIENFNTLVSEFDSIDILLYNTSYNGYPNNEAVFTSSGSIKEQLYTHGFAVQVMVPHAIAIEALKKMNSSSKIFFMTTDVIFDRERDANLHKLGYYGGKAYQHQLMLALAEHNDKEATVSSISPYFDYNNKEQYKTAFEKVYAHILGNTQNGKVYDCWE